MKQKAVLIFSCLVVLVLAVALQTSFAEDKEIEFTSVQDKGVISIYPDSFPVKRAIKGKVKGFSKQEIADLGLVVDVFILDVSQGTVPVDKKGKWEVKATLNDADLVIKAVVKDKDGNELVTKSIQATASGEF